MRLGWLAAIAAFSLVSACGSDPTSVDPRDLTYAPELGVEFSTMTRTASGLYYQDLVTGTGDEATAGTTVSVLYSAWLPNGSQFDQIGDPDNPFVFLLGHHDVIEGWDEGIVGMRIGGTRLLVIPPSLGYGNRVVGPIPANSTLVFKVQLLAVHYPASS
jgi:FKBP-type peptidyl-prolyl cis-trans isomerase FkpA